MFDPGSVKLRRGRFCLFPSSMIDTVSAFRWCPPNRMKLKAERQAICLALHATHGNKSEAATPPSGLQDSVPQDEALRYRGREIPGLVTVAETVADSSAERLRA